MCGDLPKQLGPIRIPLVLDAHTHPDVFRPWEESAQRHESLGSLGQHLKLMLGAAAHRLKHSLDKVEGNLFMEQIGHRVDEDPPRLPPLERKIYQILMECHAKPVDIARRTHRLKSLRSEEH